MTDYQIEDIFTIDPELNGWLQKQGATLDWDSIEKVGGNLGADDNCRYIKFLGKSLSKSDNITALFTIMADNAAAGTGKALIGFFNINESEGKDECFCLLLDTSTGSIVPHIYIAYNDGITKIVGIGTYTLGAGKKYVIAIRHVPEDGQAYLEIFDFTTQQLLFTESITLDTTKSFTFNQVGLSEYEAIILQTSEVWIYDMNAVAEPEAIVYSELYATPEQVRKMTNLDAIQDMTDEMIAQIETVYAIPQVNAKFRSEGYQAPFDTGDDTPPLVRTITALLTAAYAGRKSYTGHAPNESPLYETLLEEVNNIWTDILNGKMELLDKLGNWIERTEETSTDMLSTTEGQCQLFTLNDPPDITSVMTGRFYIGGCDC